MGGMRGPEFAVPLWRHRQLPLSVSAQNQTPTQISVGYCASLSVSVSVLVFTSVWLSGSMNTPCHELAPWNNSIPA